MVTFQGRAMEDFWWRTGSWGHFGDERIVESFWG